MGHIMVSLAIPEWIKCAIYPHNVGVQVKWCLCGGISMEKFLLQIIDFSNCSQRGKIEPQE